VGAEDPFWFTTADGGIIDNDPFEYARFSLKDWNKLDKRIEAALDKVDRAVIMVSPFPELKPIAREGQPASDLVSSFSALLPALIDQARFKPSEIILAADKKHGSRYLIGPSRVMPDGKEQRYGIASGLLGGFGGFVARSFRDHDFQLGRRNCQRFLRDAFVLPAENEIIKGWIAGPGARSHAAFKATPSPEILEPYPIIPLFGTAKDEVVLSAWPRISQIRFDILQTRIAERFDAVAPKLLAQYVTGPLWFLLRLAFLRWPVGLIRNKVLNFVKDSMLADLVRRDMIEGEGWELPPDPNLYGDDIRLVLAELFDPAYDLRNVAVFCKAAGLDLAKVEAMLDRFQSLVDPSKNFEVWKAPWTAKDTDKDRGALYTLMSRKPGPVKRFWWCLGRLIDLVSDRKRSVAWLSKPVVDKPGV
jgi:hypothetical protein